MVKTAHTNILFLKDYLFSYINNQQYHPFKLQAHEFFYIASGNYRNSPKIHFSSITYNLSILDFIIVTQLSMWFFETRKN